MAKQDENPFKNWISLYRFELEEEYKSINDYSLTDGQFFLLSANLTKKMDDILTDLRKLAPLILKLFKRDSQPAYFFQQPKDVPTFFDQARPSPIRFSKYFGNVKRKWETDANLIVNGHFYTFCLEPFDKRVMHKHQDSPPIFTNGELIYLYGQIYSAKHHIRVFLKKIYEETKAKEKDEELKEYENFIKQLKEIQKKIRSFRKNINECFENESLEKMKSSLEDDKTVFVFNIPKVKDQKWNKLFENMVSL